MQHLNFSIALNTWQTLVTIAIIALVGACMGNPIRTAQTVDQRSYATYGEYVIVKEQAAEFICGPAIPGNVCPGNPAVNDRAREAVRAAQRTTSPIATSLFAAAQQFTAIYAEVTACNASEDPAVKATQTCMTAQQRLQVVNDNLLRWLNQLLPALAQLKTSIGK